MLIFSLLFLSLFAHAQNGHLYIHGELDRDLKQINVSVVANTLSKTHIRSLIFKDPQVGDQEILVDKTFNPGEIYRLTFKLTKLGQKPGWSLSGVNLKDVVFSPVSVLKRNRP